MIVLMFIIKRQCLFCRQDAGGNRLVELLCHQSNIWSRGMTQCKEKAHFVKNTLDPAHGVMVRWYGCYANGCRFDSRLADLLPCFFICFFPGSA